MSIQTSRQLYSVLRPHFAELLEPRGFVSLKGARCEFHRHVSEDIVHVVSVGKHHRDASRYIVFALPSSPIIDEGLADNKPFCNLPTTNHGLDWGAAKKWSDTPSHFVVKDEAGVAESFSRSIKPMLEKHILPRLDRVKTIKKLIPLVSRGDEIALGQLYARIGKTSKAEAVVLPLVERWEQLDWSPHESGLDDVLQELRKASPRLAERLERSVRGGLQDNPPT